MIICVVKANVIMSVEVCVMRGVGEFCVIRSDNCCRRDHCDQGCRDVSSGVQRIPVCWDKQSEGEKDFSVFLHQYFCVSVCGAWDGTYQISRSGLVR